MNYNKFNFPPAPIFSELSCGDVFIHGNVAYMVIEDAFDEEDCCYNAIDLLTGYLEKFEDNDYVTPCPDAELIFRK